MVQTSARLLALLSLLQLRREWSSLFQAGTYRGVSAEGPMADRVIAFEREEAGDRVIVVAGRHLAPFMPSAETSSAQYSWEGTMLRLPKAGGDLEDVLTGRRLSTKAAAVPARELFSTLPVAVLVENRPMS